MRYSPLNKAANLNTEYISKSNSQQRAGRAGRVMPGECYHLFSKLKEDSMTSYIDPDIKRLQLEETVLNIKSLNLPIYSVKDFMRTLIEPPLITPVEDAITLLKQIGALDDLENMTPLGKKLAQIPVHPQLGKMVLMAVCFR